MHLEQAGYVVQLVRMPACHAGGREFESRRTRKTKAVKHHLTAFFFYPFTLHPSPHSRIAVNLRCWLNPQTEDLGLVMSQMQDVVPSFTPINRWMVRCRVTGLKPGEGLLISLAG